MTKPTPPVEISETDTIVNTNYSVEEPPEQENPESDESSLFEQPMAESDFSEKVMNSLLAEFEEEKIQRFLEKAAKWFLENGNLIPTNRVSKNLQEIRRFFAQKLSKSEVDLFFSVNLNNSSIQPK